MTSDRFNPMDYPLSLMQPDLLTGGSAWLEHIPFAFAVMHMCQPNTFVELGTWKGDSYCAFCQAVIQLQLPTRCTAIDTWQGDDHAGPLRATVFPALKQYHDAKYAGFSTLKQATFDQAVKDFADGSIDLLHIDGLHTYEAVKHDYESWRPKVSARGVVMFHDTQVREKDFGVWKLWEEISLNRPSFNFRHGHGLGVLALGADAPPALLRFLKIASSDGESVWAYFEALGQYVITLKQLRGTVREALDLHMLLNQHRQLIGLPEDPLYPDESFKYPQPYLKHLTGLVQQVIAEYSRRRGTGI
jgi:hypothetical protein